jgi:hypothetical protein
MDLAEKQLNHSQAKKGFGLETLFVPITAFIW